MSEATAEGDGVRLSLRQSEEQLFARFMGASLVLHAAAVIGLSALHIIAPRPPIITMERSIDIDLLVAAPNPEEGGGQKRGLPNKETFVPVAGPAPAPVPLKTDDPPKAEPEKTAPTTDANTKTEAPKEAETLAEAAKKDVPAPPSEDPGLDAQARSAMAEQIARLAEEKRRRDAIAKLTGAPGLKDRSSGVGAGQGEGDSDGLSGNAKGVDPEWAKALNDLIQPLWIVLPTLANKPLQVVVYVTVDVDGNIRDVEVKRPSGEPGLDGSAVRAVKKAQTLPMPSKSDLKSAVLKDGFELAFTPRGLAN